MSTTDAFIGKWNLVESENFDAYLKEVGVGLITRKVASTLKPTMEINVNGDHWTLTSVSTFKTFTIECDLGKEFDETTADGRVMKSICTFEHGKLIQHQNKIKPEDKDSIISRYIENGKLVVTCESGNVSSKRVYEKAA